MSRMEDVWGHDDVSPADVADDKSEGDALAVEELLEQADEVTRAIHDGEPPSQASVDEGISLLKALAPLDGDDARDVYRRLHATLVEVGALPPTGVAAPNAPDGVGREYVSDDEPIDPAPDDLGILLGGQRITVGRLRAAAAESDDVNGVKAWEPDSVDDQDPRALTAVNDALDAYERGHGESAVKRLETLARRLGLVGAPGAASGAVGGGKTIVLALSERAATLVRDCLDDALGGMHDVDEDDVLQSIINEIDGQR